MTSTSKQVIRDKVAWLCNTYNIPGLAYAGTVDGNTECVGTIGLASIPFNSPVTTDTLFHIGSVGKHMTGVAILRLAGRGLVDLDAPVGRYLQHIPDSWAGRSLRSLSHHCSGIPNYTDYIIDDREMSNEDIYRKIEKEPLRFEAGGGFDYSNTNYRLLGDVLENLCQKSYKKHMSEDVFHISGLKESVIDDCTALTQNHAEPYTLDGAFEPTGMVHARYEDSLARN